MARNCGRNLERQELVINDSARLLATSTPDQHAVATLAIVEIMQIRQGLMRIRDDHLTLEQCRTEAGRLLVQGTMQRESNVNHGLPALCADLS